MLSPYTIPAGITKFNYGFATDGSDSNNIRVYYNNGNSAYSSAYSYSASMDSLPEVYRTNNPGNINIAEGVLICGSARGDPLFTGLHGQQFYVAGVDGQVLNIISTATLQLNGRFVTLAEGDSITPAEQQKIRMASEQQHATAPDMAALPLTEAWSHPGNYFGEAGVALLDGVDGVDGHRLYAKAGPYSHGFAKLTLDGQELPVSTGFTVLGSGANTTRIQCSSTHELLIRTATVDFTVVNSDHFLNVDRVHLERGYKSQQPTRMGGILGLTADSEWQWNTADEQAAVVQSNDLFEHSQQQ